jgi:hypothetical protein
VAELRRREDRAVEDPHAVVRLVALLEPAQDRDRLLDIGLVDEDRLEPALERGVLLDVLAVLVERRRADAPQLAARQRGLEQVAGAHRALRGRAGADDRVQLVDEHDHPPVARGDLLEHRLQALLELAAVLRAREQLAHIERHDPLVAHAVGAVALHDALSASPSAIAVLPTPGSPISTGLFFVRRLSTCMHRRISSSRPITGSSLPGRTGRPLGP